MPFASNWNYGVQIPLNRLVAELAHSPNHGVVVFAVRRAKQRAAFACELLDLVVERFDLLLNLGGGQRVHVRVRFAVVADLVTGRRDRFYILRIRRYPDTAEEERRFDIIMIQRL